MLPTDVVLSATNANYQTEMFITPESISSQLWRPVMACSIAPGDVRLQHNCLAIKTSCTKLSALFLRQSEGHLKFESLQLLTPLTVRSMTQKSDFLGSTTLQLSFCNFLSLPVCYNTTNSWTGEYLIRNCSNSSQYHTGISWVLPFQTSMHA